MARRTTLSRRRVPDRTPHVSDSSRLGCHRMVPRLSRIAGRQTANALPPAAPPSFMLRHQQGWGAPYCKPQAFRRVYPDDLRACARTLRAEFGSEMHQSDQPHIRWDVWCGEDGITRRPVAPSPQDTRRAVTPSSGPAGGGFGNRPATRMGSTGRRFPAWREGLTLDLGYRRL